MEKTLIVKIAVASATLSIDRLYDYNIPEPIKTAASIGSRVIVPFGNGNRRTEGVILSVAESSKYEKLKSVERVLDPEPVLGNADIKMILWTRERAFCTFYEALRAVLPAGVWYRLETAYYFPEGVDGECALNAAGKSKSNKLLAETLINAGGRVSLPAIEAAFGDKNPAAAIRNMTKLGVLACESAARRGISDKTSSVARMLVSAEETAQYFASVKSRSPLQRAVMEMLSVLGTADTKDLCYYTGATMATMKALERLGLIELEKREAFRRPKLAQVREAAGIVLNGTQEKAFDILNDLSKTNEPAAALLFGVTGSGKTQVYIKLIKEIVARGKTALALVPEIALTPQLTGLFRSHFGENVAVLHSGLSIGERYDEWKRIKNGLADIVVGTRSAVFAPLRDIGVIILDEEHDQSYKSENTPRYHARDVAKFRCVQHGALLVLGSATPAVETYYSAKNGGYKYIELSERYNSRRLPEVIFADMRDELRNGNGGIISSTLKNELEHNINNGEQSILFINRRGNSKLVACGECGYIPYCSRCSVPLTFHSANGRLMCHYCGYSAVLPEECPECGGIVKFIGAGTQKAQEELEELFPFTELLRMDTDTVSASNTHEKILEKFRTKKVPILIGTQMVTKGLDFENVTLVGVLGADASLYMDDFRAYERAFSLITQVIGRAGRGEKPGRAVIQTLTPGNPVLKFAAGQDYASFYESEIKIRAARRMPPFTDIIIITVFGAEQGAVLRACLRLRGKLEAYIKADTGFGEVMVYGPAPASVEKVNNRYRYRLTLCCENNKSTRNMVMSLIIDFKGDKQNRGVSVFADENPNN